MPPQTKRKKPLSPSTRPAKPLPNTDNIHILEKPLPSSPNPADLGLDSDIPEVVRSLPYVGKKSARTLLARGLPPMSQLGDIYRDMTDRAMDLGLDRALAHLRERPLRVVTVCSGTESPLLALEMVQRNTGRKFGETFNFKHLFSAEIVPFKQAYIERNFRPRYLFRDVAELKDRVAQTAYGSLEKVPKNPDILIAGFSCVDFSGLNNNRKSLDEKGESGGTFWGIIRYAITYRPRMVILENVKNAPWDGIKEKWNEINYFAVHMAVDTKAYYLPQTRERGYMFCIDRGLLEKHHLTEDDMEQWLVIFTGFKRPASSPASEFLMDGNDRRLEQIEKDMAAYITSSSARTAVNWARYQIRHQGYRLEQNLGHRRPISRSQEDGTCQMPDFAWQTYVRSLPERVWDTIDANFLRKLGENGYDMNFKERCIDLSQGLDRETDTRAYGIVGCITPCGIPYITTRGGPLCGLEALALQGLPLERLLLTRERHRELQDLAGNAMSSTVVGAAILSALIVGYKVLDSGSNSSSPRTAVLKHKRIIPRDDYPLVPSGVLLGQIFNVAIAELQMQATRSARYCMCERQTATRQNILRCTLCNHTACSDCGGNPTHVCQRWTSLIRSQPMDFVSSLKNILPTRLVLSGVSRADYHIFNADALGCPSTVWENFLEAVTRAVGDELRFLDIKRSEDWTALYEGKLSILNLVISSTSINWLFFAKPSDCDPALCLNREILSRPIARMTPISGSLLDGEWEVCAPISSSCTTTFAGTGGKVMSYEARCGLQMKQFIGSTVWNQITVQASDEDVRDLEVDIRGTYDLLPECGTANASLHKKSATTHAPVVYLFLDPHKINEAENDSFVFSLEHRRIPGYAPRLTIAEVSHRWRSSRATSEPELVNVYHRKWSKVQGARLAPYNPDAPIDCVKLRPGTDISVENAECRNTNVTLLSFSVPATVINSPTPKGSWEVIDPIESSDLLRDLSWLVQRTAGFSEFQQWARVVNNQMLDHEDNSICAICVPQKPQILWGRNKKGWIRAYEDPHDAALYERQIKAKPSPFLVFRRVDEHHFGNLRVTLNIQTLLHQACDKLVGSKIDGGVSFFWRLLPNAHDARNMIFPKFQLTSNKSDSQSSQPPRFLLSLRPEQLRSLSWMVGQENENVAAFEEEETEEAFLPLMMWRAEARVTARKVIRGGVIADDVGYGKTAIVLGLIDIQAERAYKSARVLTEGLIPTNATLIVVPHIMLPQWKSEIEKFLGHKYKVLVLQSAASFTSKTIRDVRNADIILVSWSVFNNGGYYQKMHKFTSMPRVPTKAGRNFDHWFQDAQFLLRSNVEILVNQGPNALLNVIRTKRQEVKSTQANSMYAPSRRLRGRKYAEANQGKVDTNLRGHYADISSAEESEDNDSEYPDRLKANVDERLKLQPSTSHDARPAHGPDGQIETDPEDEEIKYEDSSTESHIDGHYPSRKKRKHDESERVTNGKSRWNDRKEFNINKGRSQNWETVKNPLLHAFSFNRLVIDEFTYANPERLAPLLSLEARSKWILSGTPPLNDFADVNTIAPFLGVHLGIDDDYEEQTHNKRLKTLWKHRTEAEAFQSFKAPHSEAWHRRRHEIAQRFLDRFARKNNAEIDEIPWSEHIVLINQSPAERAIYLELYKQLMAQNRQLRRRNQGRFGNDQIERLDEIIGSSTSPEEALLKRCSSLALQGRWDNGKPETVTCKSLLSVREKQLGGLLDDILQKFKLAAWIYCGCDLKYESFHKFVESLIRHDFGDGSVTERAYPLLKNAVFTSKHDDWKLFFSEPQDQEEISEGSEAMDQHQSEPEAEDGQTEAEEPPKKFKKGDIKKSRAERIGRKNRNNKRPKGERSILPARPRRVYEYELILREVTSTLRNLIVEWVLRERALRFLRTVRLIQTGTEIPGCDGCKSEPGNPDDLNILGSCGHALCAKCAWETVQKEECAVEGCRGSGKPFNVIKASTLGHDGEDKSATFGGSKLDRLIEIVRAIPKDERALLFIQFPDLIQVASKALELAQIKHTVISPTDRRSAQKVEQFQKTSFGENRVLVLNLGGEMAAGLNLQCANHVIFLSPMLGQTQYDYDSSMAQAIGRCRRYGQTKHIHVYYLLAKLTIDVNIFQERRQKVLFESRESGQPVLVTHDEAVESEAMSCEGPSLVMDNAF